MSVTARYPIATEKYIAAMRLAFGPNKAAEEAHREIIPLVNHAYEAGLKSAGGFPLNLDEVRRAFVETYSVPLKRVQDNFLITGMIQWINEAYAQGCEDAEGPQGKEVI